jgi:hypothetical protein
MWLKNEPLPGLDRFDARDLLGNLIESLQRSRDT